MYIVAIPQLDKALSWFFYYLWLLKEPFKKANKLCDCWRSYNAFSHPPSLVLYIYMFDKADNSWLVKFTLATSKSTRQFFKTCNLFVYEIGFCHGFHRHSRSYMYAAILVEIVMVECHLHFVPFNNWDLYLRKFVVDIYLSKLSEQTSSVLAG